MEKNEEDVIIKFKELKKVIPECLSHVHDLLDTAKCLHDNSKFDHSIMINILAYEEINKLAVFVEHQKNSKNITRKTLRELKHHNYKLTKIVDSQLEHEKRNLNSTSMTSSKTQETFLKDLNQSKIHLSLLNFIKQMIMYYDFRENRSITLKNHFKNNGLNHFSSYFAESVHYQLHCQLLIHKFGNSELQVFLNKIDKTSDEWKNVDNFKSQLDSLYDVETHKKFWNILEEIKSLQKHMKKENLSV